MANIDINRRAVIEAHVEACRDAVLTNAVELGRWLNRAKEEQIVPHGEWEEWVRTHAGMSERSAQRLMQAAREVPEGSPLERLGVAKIEALLMLPAGEREQAAEEMDAANLSSRQVWREARERAGKTTHPTAEAVPPSQGTWEGQEEGKTEARRGEAPLPGSAGKGPGDRLDPVEALRMAKAAKEEAEDLKRQLETARAETEMARAGRERYEMRVDALSNQLENTRQALAMERRKAPQVVEKLPDDYVEMKKRLAAAEKEADRLADELDRAKLGAAKEQDGSPAARILAAIGAFLAEAGSFPAALHRKPDLMDREDWELVESRVRLLDEWVMHMRGANWNG